MGIDGLDEAAEREQRKFGVDLTEFRIEHGAPSVASLVNPKVPGMSKGNLSAVFNGERLPSMDVAMELVRDIAKKLTNAERTTLEAQWRQRWQEVKRATVAAEKAARQERVVDTRVAAGILTAARQEAEQILIQAAADAQTTATQIISEAEAGADALRTETADQIVDAHEKAQKILTQAQRQADLLIAHAQAEVEEIRAGAQARVEAEASAALAKKDQSAARVLAFAQRIADEAIAEARREATKIVAVARAGAEDIQIAVEAVDVNRKNNVARDHVAAVAAAALVLMDPAKAAIALDRMDPTVAAAVLKHVDPARAATMLRPLRGVHRGGVVPEPANQAVRDSAAVGAGWERGTVKKNHSAEGLGYITDAQGGDVVFHVYHLETTVEEGQAVEFYRAAPADHPGYWNASVVRPVSSATMTIEARSL